MDESRLRLEVPPVGLTARNRAYIASAGALMACGMGLSLAAIAGSSSLVGSLLLSIPLLGLSYALFMRALVVTCLEEILEFDMAANSWRLVKQLVLPGRRGRTMQQQPTAAAGAGTAAAAGGGRYLGMLQLERGCITDLLPPLLITHANVSLPAAMGPLGQPLGASAVQLSDGESAAYVGEQLAPREQLWLAQELAAAVERAKAERAQQ